MAVQKQPITINFSQGLDTKTDPFQVQLGKFLRLKNSIFKNGVGLDKRNGFGFLPSLPDSTSSYITTFHGGLTAIGSNLKTLSTASNSWVTKGTLEPVSLSTSSLARAAVSLTQCDSAISSNGLVCVAYTEATVGGTTYKYSILNQETGDIIVAPTIISANASGSPRVFILGNYFMIVFTSTITATPHLQYLAINMFSLSVTGPTDISTQYTPASTVAFDGVTAGGLLYLAWNGSDVGGAIRVTLINQSLTQSGTSVFASNSGNLFSVCSDDTFSTPVIWVTFGTSGSSAAKTLAVDHALNTFVNPTAVVSGGDPAITNIASASINGVCQLFFEANNNYSYDAAIATHYIYSKTINTTPTVSSATTILRSVGIASKAFLLDSTPYLLSCYKSTNQSTYFLINGSGAIIGKLAYENAKAYNVLGNPSVTLIDGAASMSYLFAAQIQSVNKSQGSSTPNGVYVQTGVNLANWDFSSDALLSAEIANNLHLTGGFLTMYDGNQPVEHGFHVWPDSVEVTTSGTGGSITAQQYYYSALYEWTDAQGNIHRSAPSIPVSITTTGSTSTNTINVPTLRLTAKSGVKIILYRWSAAQQIYYQVTSITSPTLNSTSTDSVAITDTLADSSILGNSILYTTGGVLENIGAPATDLVTLWGSRLFLVPSEDRNLIQFSQPVIEGTPVEMSDLLTIYVAPTIGAQGNTGDTTAIASMDDKLIIFKRSAIYYITGVGPDITGANNQYSEPIFITSTVGCARPRSIVFMPQGLMFQSDKGIWLLGRDLSTRYIGSDVEAFNDDAVLSAITVPGTNEVRFNLESGTTLMYDYYFDQWGEFDSPAALYSTLYENLHTYIDSLGRVFQETPGLYLDGGKPVLLSFTTAWAKLAGLQGYQRAYFFYFLGKYLSPHKISLQIAYDYELPSQSVILTPDNFSAAFGGDSLFGGSDTFGGKSNIENWRIFFDRQKCESFQITFQEIFDAAYGTAPGAGISLSGLNLIAGMKSGYPRLAASRATG